ncbi:hypothetical protein HDV06_003317 [Boothiomyces sp. JEL0866]|nr:hypothetical protein HDV06_003317 [Boothiomyces sp. JEL0866]
MPFKDSVSQFPVTLSKSKIRFYRQGDQEDLVNAINNWNVTKYMDSSIPYPYTMDDANYWIEINEGMNRPHYSFAVEVDGKVIGSVGYQFKNRIYSKTIAIGYWIAEPYWRRGIISEVVNWLVDFIKTNEPNCIRIEAGIFEPNCGSYAVLKKCGFHKEAVLQDAISKCDLVYNMVMMVLLIKRNFQRGQ